ncbi:MAG: Holliday junction resolvase RuvX [Nitrospinota bacterium]|nr:Holliday junction resolvase RuvX [Nitrospinota bacterium]
MKTLSLDFGSKYIGVAISDDLGIIAVGLEVIKREYLKNDIDRIKTIIEENGVEELVVGLPKKLNNDVGIQADKTIAFVESLKENIDIPIQMWDERLTTAEAQKMLISMNVSRSKRKKVIDKVAAQLILDSYLQFKKNRKNRE